MRCPANTAAPSRGAVPSPPTLVCRGRAGFLSAGQSSCLAPALPALGRARTRAPAPVHASPSSWVRPARPLQPSALRPSGGSRCRLSHATMWRNRFSEKRPGVSVCVKPGLTRSLLAALLSPKPPCAPGDGSSGAAALVPPAGMAAQPPWPRYFLIGTFEDNSIVFLIFLALMNAPNLVNVSVPEHSGSDRDFSPPSARQRFAPCPPVPLCAALPRDAEHGDPCGTGTDAFFIPLPARCCLSALKEPCYLRCRWKLLFFFLRALNGN